MRREATEVNKEGVNEGAGTTWKKGDNHFRH